MQTISTKYLPATNTKPARVKAYLTCAPKVFAIVSRDSDECRSSTTLEPHKRAVAALVSKVGWSRARYIIGTTREGFIFVPSTEPIFTA